MVKRLNLKCRRSYIFEVLKIWGLDNLKDNAGITRSSEEGVCSQEVDPELESLLTSMEGACRKTTLLLEMHQVAFQSEEIAFLRDLMKKQRDVGGDQRRPPEEVGCHRWKSRPAEILTVPMANTHLDSTVIPQKEITLKVSKGSERQQRSRNGQKLFICSECGKSFNKYSHLKLHLLVHTGEKPFKCRVCEKDFNHPSSLRKHEITHTGEKPFKCSDCEKSFNDSSNLSRHKRIHSGEKPFKCNMCKKEFTYSHHLLSHQRTHTGEKPYQCPTCKKEFSQSSSLVMHQRTHADKSPYKCSTCEKRFQLSRHLVSHRCTHAGEKPLEYKKEYQRDSNVAKQKQLYTGELPTKCIFCSKMFHLSHNLMNQKYLHTGEKPYQCSACRHKFNQCSALMKCQHGGERPYLCSVCDKGLKGSSTLMHHIVTGSSPHHCTGCGKCLKNSSNHIQHQTVLMEERPYRLAGYRKSFKRAYKGCTQFIEPLECSHRKDSIQMYEMQESL
ncbi:zinc finger protein ZFP2-like [Narcine bancroftii]|uniref:zinc finger protein ZFP2-like n=1 Tax=Narcine bancroftii TaxID=1343680 RepID=UPI00383201D3